MKRELEVYSKEIVEVGDKATEMKFYSFDYEACSLNGIDNDTTPHLVDVITYPIVKYRNGGGLVKEFVIKDEHLTDFILSSNAHGDFVTLLDNERRRMRRAILSDLKILQKEGFFKRLFMFKNLIEDLIYRWS